MAKESLALAPSVLPGWCPLVGTLVVLVPLKIHDNWVQVGLVVQLELHSEYQRPFMLDGMGSVVLVLCWF